MDVDVPCSCTFAELARARVPDALVGHGCDCRTVDGSAIVSCGLLLLVSIGSVGLHGNGTMEGFAYNLDEARGAKDLGVVVVRMPTSRCELAALRGCGRLSDGESSFVAKTFCAKARNDWVDGSLARPGQPCFVWLVFATRNFWIG